MVMRSTFSGLACGLSLAGAPEPEERELAALPLGGFLRGVELSGRLLELRSCEAWLRRRRPTAVNVIDLMPASITRGIALQRPGIIADFKRQFFRVLDGFSGAPVDCVTIDFGLDEAMENEEYHRRLLEFLRGMAMELHLLRISLTLPVRIPEYRPDFTQFCLRLRQQVMLPSLGFALEIHPHELGRDFNPDELLRWLRFDLGAVRFGYEPDIGNHLVSKAVQPWFDYLRRIGFSGLVTFCPRAASFEQLAQEAENVQELLRALHQE